MRNLHQNEKLFKLYLEMNLTINLKLLIIKNLSIYIFFVFLQSNFLKKITKFVSFDDKVADYIFTFDFLSGEVANCISIWNNSMYYI